jgi:hypothetical protein
LTHTTNSQMSCMRVGGMGGPGYSSVMLITVTVDGQYALPLPSLMSQALKHSCHAAGNCHQDAKSAKPCYWVNWRATCCCHCTTTRSCKCWHSAVTAATAAARTTPNDSQTMCQQMSQAPPTIEAVPDPIAALLPVT